MSRTIRNCCSRWSLDAWLALFLCVSCLLSMLTGCVSSHRAQEKTIRVGIALYTQEDTFIATIVQALERTAREVEGEQNLKINLSTADGRQNQTTQLEQVDRLISRGCDVLCVNIVDRTAAAVIADKAEAAGVPLIFFNRQPVAEDIQRWEQIYYVGARAEESGTIQGQIVLDAWLEKQEALDRNGDGVLQYAMLEGEPGHQDALLRTEYSIKTLTDAGVEVEKLVSDTANWNRGQAATKMQQWLEVFGSQIEVIFVNNDDMALGVLDVLLAEEADLPMVVGVDATAPALEAVRAGTLAGTVRNDAQGIAQAVLDLVLALAEGSDPAQAVALEEKHYVWLPYQRVTLENLDDFL